MQLSTTMTREFLAEAIGDVGDNGLLIQLPGVRDPDSLIQAFRVQARTPSSSDGRAASRGSGYLFYLPAEVLELARRVPGSGGGGQGAPAAEPPVDPLAQSLTESEVRVLRYLPTRLSAGEIARELYLSVNTVKTHIRHVYDKLGVNRRRYAVERAQALGLLRAGAFSTS